MAKVLGIIGGGQLGMMLAEAAKKMPQEISKVIVLDPAECCPASQVGATQITAGFKDRDAIIQLAEKSDIVTYEIESGDCDILKSVEDKTQISPSPDTLRVIQDKYLQKTFLRANGIPVPDFVKIESVEDVTNGIMEFGYPVLLKARRDGYDGRGNYKIDSENDVEKAYRYFKGQQRELLLERFVPFQMEVSVIASRNTGGQIKTYPLVENIHEENILRQTVAPARVSSDTAKRAEKVARTVIGVMHGAGTFGIEMFVEQNGLVSVNEIAPRVHNSGHHSLQSSETSQFEQHLRAILGLELGSTNMMYSTVMYNILGPMGFQGEYANPTITKKNLFLKMYGKKVSKPHRKLGHVNLVGSDGQSVDQLIGILETIKDELTVQPAN